MRKLLLLTVLCAAAAVPARALDLGDQAPAIAAETWITGEPVDPTAVDGESFYLVEVWSTTCPPCVMTIPILNDLQKRYADEGFKIVSFTSDNIEDVQEFLKLHPIEYSSFLDKESTSTVNYMAVDNRNTIPHAFLFDRSGAMVWTGNPLDNLEQRVKQVIDGTLNKEKAVAVRDARDELQTAFSSQDIDGMVTALKKLQTIEPDNGQYYQLHYRIISELGMGDASDVRELLAAWFKGCQDQPESLIVLSVLAMDQGPPAFRNPELGLAAAKRAYELDSASKFEAGLNLAETYKSMGRVDVALKVIAEISKDVEPERVEMLTSIESFYNMLLEMGKTAEF